MLLFICFLENEHEIDLSQKDTTLGEIYTRLVRCLCRKFKERNRREQDGPYCRKRRKKEIPLSCEELLGIMERLGRIAWETLISGKYSMKTKEIFNRIGDSAFDYGLIVGHENFRLRGAEMADIFITFVHRTIQEFLGAFFFIVMLSRGIDIDTLYPNHGNFYSPIFLYNRVFLEFCIWFTHCEPDLLPVSGLRKAKMALKTLILQYIDLVQFDLLDISYMYPALHFPIQKNVENLPVTKFCVELFRKCKLPKELGLGENCWVLKEMKTCLQNIDTITVSDCPTLLNNVAFTQNELNIIIQDDAFGLDKLLQKVKLKRKIRSLWIFNRSGYSRVNLYENVKNQYFFGRADPQKFWKAEKKFWNFTVSNMFPTSLSSVS